MDDERLHIDPEIENASTLPSRVYTDRSCLATQLERVFFRGWHPAPAEPDLRAGTASPWTLLPGSLDEPLMLTRDEEGTLRCLSNVCTHRGNLILEETGPAKALRCGYHGRRFGPDGRFLSMPEFEAACGFPSAADDLPGLELETWGPLTFVAPSPAWTFDEWLSPARSRLDWLPLAEFDFDPASSRDYTVAANWALYCDNYLEGFHIPFVHEGLASQLDYPSYRTEIARYGCLQLGIAAGDEATFDLPTGHRDHGQRVSAYYYWFFPNLMLNFYPWGISVNVVEPLGVDRTRVRFLSYVHDESLRATGAGADLHSVEMEDEAVVENVQRGVRSRLYDRGRFSPSREQGVHLFHRLLSQFMNQV